MAGDTSACLADGTNAATLAQRYGLTGVAALLAEAGVRPASGAPEQFVAGCDAGVRCMVRLGWPIEARGSDWTDRARVRLNQRTRAPAAMVGGAAFSASIAKPAAAL